MSEPVPSRVLAAEARREFREQLARGSLGCPCGHLLADHDADDWDRDGEPVNRRCRAAGCECGPATYVQVRRYRMRPDWKDRKK